MTINFGYAVITATSSAVLLFGNTAYAEGTDFLGYPPSPTVNQAIDISTPIAGQETQTPTEYPTVIPPPEQLAPAYTEELPEPEAIATEVNITVASEPTQSTSRSGYVSDPRNTYAWGYCTWYVKNKRPDLPNSLGNGGQWVANAAARGFATGNVPRAGAVGEQPGHVVYVESVNANGTVNISEMNYNGGLGVVNHRTVPASMFKYIY